MVLEIRQITEITEALSEAFTRLTPQLSVAMDVPSSADLRQIVQGGNTALFAAFGDGRIAGVLSLVWYDVPSGRKAWIEDVVVDAAFRGCGAGEALVQAALAHAAQLGAAKVQLTSNKARTAAHALYRKVGFEEAETTVFVFKTDNKQ